MFAIDTASTALKTLAQASEGTPAQWAPRWDGGAILYDVAGNELTQVSAEHIAEAAAYVRDCDDADGEHYRSLYLAQGRRGTYER